MTTDEFKVKTDGFRKPLIDKYREGSAGHGRKKKIYHLIAPDGEKVTVTNISAWAKQTFPDSWKSAKVAMSYLKVSMTTGASCKYSQYRGWTLESLLPVHKKKQEVKITYRLISPDGENVTVTNISAWAKQTFPDSWQSAATVICRLKNNASCRVLQYRGWTLESLLPIHKKRQKEKSCYRLISPDGEKVTVTNLSAWAKQTFPDSWRGATSMISRLHRAGAMRSYYQYKGWMIDTEE